MNNTSDDIKQGWLKDIAQKPSPNKNERPDTNNVSLIIVHNISLPPNQFGECWIDDFFLNKLDPKQHPYFEEICELKVSSHLLIRRDGNITQYVPFHERAWHAGLSNFDGADNCNDFSIGIELEGADHIAYTEEQYIALSSCCRALIDAYPMLSEETIVGHCDVSPGRKTDPGESFDWVRFRNLLSRR